MEELKFRAWDKSKKEFIEPAYVLIDGLGNPFSSEHRTPAPFVLMQYTGLKDKNGTLIFEGDVVEKICQKTDRVETERFIVVFDYDGFSLLRNNSHYAFGFSLKGKLIKEKVIGNIYENPELLT